LVAINVKSQENIEQIAAIMMHELKSPLALISANVDYLELCDEDKKFLRNYSVVKSEVEKANRILNDFISVLNGAGNSSKKIGICEIISEIIESYIATYGNDITFSFDFKADKNIEDFIADKMAYTIVFGNTIKNAIESIKVSDKKNSGSINIISGFEKSKIVLKVIDNGVGLSDAELSLLNTGEPFTTKEKGSGVGVNICKKIMKELGGSYSISNNKFKEGCIVEIIIPS